MNGAYACDCMCDRGRHFQHFKRQTTSVEMLMSLLTVIFTLKVVCQQGLVCQPSSELKGLVE